MSSAFYCDNWSRCNSRGGILKKVLNTFFPSSVTKMLSTSEAREKESFSNSVTVLTTHLYFFLDQGPPLHNLVNNHLILHLNIIPPAISHRNVAMLIFLYENISWNCRFIRRTCNFLRNLTPLWIAHFYLLPRTLISCSF